MQAIIHLGESPPQLLAARHEQLAPLTHGAVLGDGAIVTPHVGRGFQALHPTARLDAPVGFPEELIPVRDAAREVAHVDKVKTVRLERPLLGAVVDLAGGRTLSRVQRKCWKYIRLTTSNSGVPRLAGSARDQCQ